MVVLENEAFLTALTLMYQKSRLSSSVIVTLKRYDGRTKPIPKGELISTDTEEYSCLFRASLRNKKISTIVSADGLAKFQTLFSNTIKANLDGLKKQKKAKSKAKAAQ